MPTDIDLSGNDIHTDSVFKTGRISDALGGRVTISPPSKIPAAEHPDVKVLVSSIDTLNLSVNVIWKSKSFFEKLAGLKQLAIEKEKPAPGLFPSQSNPQPFIFNIKPHGARGYEWILDCNEYLLNIGNWQKPKSMPSVLVYIKSETLWRSGVRQAVENILSFLNEQEGLLKSIKLSRVDLCMDTLFPEPLWNQDLNLYRVTQSTKTNFYYSHHHLTGIKFGEGSLSARLYDKVMEIKQRSNKTWMFEVWGINDVPEGYKIIRIEFQLRREAIKELGLDQYSDLFRLQQNVWKYCTEKWLKFQDNPGKQSKLRKTFPWWQNIQNGFKDSFKAFPAIRNKAISSNQEQLFCQAHGMLTSYAALLQEKDALPFGSEVTITDQLNYFFVHAKNKGIKEEEVTKAVKDKRAKYRRLEEKTKAANDKRKSLYLTK